MTRHISKLLVVAILFFCYLVYRPGLDGLFRFDDFPNILNNPYIAINTFNFDSLYLATISGGAGPLGRPLSMLSFSINYLFTEFNPYYFKLTNLIIHLLNGILVYLLALALIRQKRFLNSFPDKKLFALMLCAGWLLLPLNVSGVLYVVQRMNQLSSLFVLLGLWLYTRYRSTDSTTAVYKISCALIFCLAAAAFSKENGVLLLPLALLIELCFFNFESKHSFTRRFLIALYVISIAIPLSYLAIKICIKPEIITAPYLLRTFSLDERLMTESRVIWYYLRQILIPNSQLFGFHLDDFEVSQSLLHPISTLPAVISIVIVSILSVIQLIRKQSIWAFAVLFFLIGHSLESTIIGLEIAYEHRNYLPSLGPLFALFYYFNLYRYKFQLAKLAHLIIFAYLLSFAYLSYTRSVDWANVNDLKFQELRNHPESARTNLDAAYTLMFSNITSKEDAQKNYQNIYDYFAKSAELNKAKIGALVGLIELHSKFNFAIEPSWTNAIIYRLKNYPISSDSAISIETLYNCYDNRKCYITPSQLKEILEVARANPRISKSGKFMIQVVWASYLLRQENNPDLAIRELIGISDSAADIVMRIELVKFCLKNALPTCSANILDKAKNTPNNLFYRSTIIELERALKLGS